MKHGVILQGITAQLATVPDLTAAHQELTSFVNAVYRHNDARYCSGNCAKRAEVRQWYQRLAQRGVDVDELQAVMDLVEQIQGHDRVLDQVLRLIGVRLGVRECQPA